MICKVTSHYWKLCNAINIYILHMDIVTITSTLYSLHVACALPMRQAHMHCIGYLFLHINYIEIRRLVREGHLAGPLLQSEQYSS